MNAYRLLFADLVERLGWRLPALVALMATVGLGEGMAVALFLPLLNKIGIASSSGSGLAGRILEQFLQRIGAVSAFELLAIIIAIAAAQTGLSLTLNWWITRLAQQYQSQRRRELFAALIGVKWRFMVDRKAGELTSAIITECERLGVAFTNALSIVSATIVALVYLAVALFVAWQVTLCLIAFAVVGALAMMRFYAMTYRAGRSLGPLNAELQSTLVEQFAGFKIIKATASEDRSRARVDPLIRSLERVNALVIFLPTVVRGLFELLAVVALSIILVVASVGMRVAGGNIVVVFALFARLFPRLTTLQAQLHYLNGQVHSIEVIERLKSAAEADAEPPDRAVGIPRFSLPTSLVVQSLEVRFGDRVILDRVDTKLALPGMLAVVGASGAGKSTLIHTLLGLIEPSAGSIRLGKYDLCALPLRAWRGQIGYVPQETILFHASIRENLMLAYPDASPADVELAARRAHANVFIEALPQGYDTVIGDQGVKLSGGQRQRLGIARALLRNPILLLMDEAMSALDAQAEAELLRTLEELRRDMGIVIVAHRLAAVRTADSICVIEAGRVAETGTWAELMARKSRLYSLAEAHAGDDDRSVAAV